MKITTNNCTLVERELMITDKKHNEDEEHDLTMKYRNSNCTWDDISGIEWIKLKLNPIHYSNDTKNITLIIEPLHYQMNFIWWTYCLIQSFVSILVFYYTKKSLEKSTTISYIPIKWY
jgi:hypothetical protein